MHIERRFATARDIVGPDYRGWMNPTQMLRALQRAKVSVAEQSRESLYCPGTYKGRLLADYGVTRIQFDGPWCNDGVNPAAAHHHTHWVASIVYEDQEVFAFDCNFGWMNIGEFMKDMDKLAKSVPRGYGGWWPTHCYEISIPS